MEGKGKGGREHEGREHERVGEWGEEGEGGVSYA